MASTETLEPGGGVPGGTGPGRPWREMLPGGRVWRDIDLELADHEACLRRHLVAAGLDGETLDAELVRRFGRRQRLLVRLRLGDVGKELLMKSAFVLFVFGFAAASGWMFLKGFENQRDLARELASLREAVKSSPTATASVTPRRRIAGRAQFDGRPLPYHLVSLSSRDHGQLPPTKTDSEGLFAFENTKAGRYQVSIQVDLGPDGKPLTGDQAYDDRVRSESRYKTSAVLKMDRDTDELTVELECGLPTRLTKVRLGEKLLAVLATREAGPPDKSGFATCLRLAQASLVPEGITYDSFHGCRPVTKSAPELTLLTSPKHSEGTLTLELGVRHLEAKLTAPLPESSVVELNLPAGMTPAKFLELLEEEPVSGPERAEHWGGKRPELKLLAIAPGS